LRRECRIASAALYARARNLLLIAHGTSGAARIRHSLRPLDFEGGKFPANLGRIVPREYEAVFAVIASGAMVQFDIAAFFTFRDGRIAEIREIIDTFDMVEQVLERDVSGFLKGEPRDS